MNYFAFCALFVGTSSVLTGTLVILKNPKGVKNLSFLYLCLFVALWSFFYTAWQMSTTYNHALHYIRLSIFFAVFIPVANFSAVMHILDLATPRRILFLNILFLITASTAATAPTSLFIPRVEQKLDFPFWPVPGPLMHIHFINLFIPSVWTIYLIWKKNVAAGPLQRNKLKWLLPSHLIAYAGGMSNNLLWYDIPVKPYLSILSSVALFGVASTFFRAALLDINYIGKKTGQMALVLITTGIAVYVSLYFFTDRLSHPTLICLASALGILFYPPFRKILEAALPQIFNAQKISAKEIHFQREKVKESTYTFRDLAQNLAGLTWTTFAIDSTAVYFYDTTRKGYVLTYEIGMSTPLARNLMMNRSSLMISEDTPLILHLQKNPEPLNMEALLNDSEDTALQPLIEQMQKIEAEICFPFVFGEKIRGLYVVGRKKNMSLFNEEEMEVLNSYTQMGTEIMRYILSLETELNHTALYSHDMNHDIRSLMQTLQFLRSPMAKSAPEERIQSLLGNAERVAENLFDSFQVNRDRSVLIMKILRGEYEKKPVPISSVLNLSAGKFALQAEKSSVTYSVNVEPTDKTVLGNELDLARVIDNVIANAFRYLPPENPRLAVSGKTSSDGYEIDIVDNGEGIEPENLDNIWKVGWQAKDAKRGAAGLGLAIVKQIIQAHNGTIQAVSQGKGTGTTFHLVLPFSN